MPMTVTPLALAIGSPLSVRITARESRPRGDLKGRSSILEI